MCLVYTCRQTRGIHLLDVMCTPVIVISASMPLCMRAAGAVQAVPGAGAGAGRGGVPPGEAGARGAALPTRTTVRGVS